MDETLIAYWNAKVQPNDIVWHLGDFSFRGHSPEYYLNRLNGQIYLVLGNHDDLNRIHGMHTADTVGGKKFQAIETLKELKVEGQKITLCHYSMRVWNTSHHGAWHLYGHSHGTIEKSPWGKSIDVGVDNANTLGFGYAPMAFEELKPIMDKKQIALIDHHGVR
jgi:calcineurin-like phosphoesterase family protein